MPCRSCGRNRNTNARRQSRKRKYQQGGLAVGPRHSRGGIPGVVGPERTPIEFEGGEYIHRREAVDKYGEEFMSKVNTMQFKPGDTYTFSEGGGVRKQTGRRTHNRSNRRIAPQGKLRSVNGHSTLHAPKIQCNPGEMVCMKHDTECGQSGAGYGEGTPGSHNWKMCWYWGCCPKRIARRGGRVRRR
jgi:hypothetical protein